MLVPDHALTTTKDWFCVIDWRSLKLPRVSHSSMGAGTQAESPPTDFICRFWYHLLNPNLRLACRTSEAERRLATSAGD